MSVWQDGNVLLSREQVAEVLGVGKWEVLKLLGHLLIWRRGMTMRVGDLRAYLDSIETPADNDAPWPSPRGGHLGGYRTWPGPERDYAGILLRDPCSYCGGSSEAIDHITARARHGAHVWSNFTGACGSCNSSKGARPLLRFLLARATT